jgi:hypothetical protein
MKKHYLSDGVYAVLNGRHLVLLAEDNEGKVHNIIFLNPEGQKVLSDLLSFTSSE